MHINFSARSLKQSFVVPILQNTLSINIRNTTNPNIYHAHIFLAKLLVKGQMVDFSKYMKDLIDTIEGVTFYCNKSRLINFKTHLKKLGVM
jgi:hypothetical protein